MLTTDKCSARRRRLHRPPSTAQKKKKIELDLVKKERVERTEVEKEVLVGYAIVKYSVEDVHKKARQELSSVRSQHP